MLILHRLIARCIRTRSWSGRRISSSLVCVRWVLLLTNWNVDLRDGRIWLLLLLHVAISSSWCLLLHPTVPDSWRWGWLRRRVKVVGGCLLLLLLLLILRGRLHHLLLLLRLCTVLAVVHHTSLLLLLLASRRLKSKNTGL